jgi:hypothetical protein
MDNMNYTMPEWVLLVTAIGIAIKGWIDSWKQNVKLDAINTTAKIIEGHVNSATTKADERAQAGMAREIKLQETIDDMKKTAAVLASAAAVRESNIVNKVRGSTGE